MLRLQWDPERYDYVSEHQLWCATWSIWDLTERGAYVEVRCFAFLDLGFIAVFGAGLATVFIWTAVTFWKDWMSTDNQRGQIESDSFLSMVPDSVARASDETAEDMICKTLFTLNFL